MSELDLEPIKERVAKATQTGWYREDTSIIHNGFRLAVVNVRDDGTPLISDQDLIEMRANADLIAHARQDIPALIAEVERLRAENAWWPIETAPKDGRLILAYVAECQDLEPFMCIMAWHDDAGWCADELREVTHWRPLPAEPSEEQ